MVLALQRQQDYDIVKIAQYLTSLTIQQDVWSEAGKALVKFMGADLVAFAERLPDGKMITYHHIFSNQRVGEAWTRLTHLPTDSNNEQIDQPFDDQNRSGIEIREAIKETLESGFLTTHLVLNPEVLSLAFLPITQENKVAAVMIVGYCQSGTFPNDLLNLYLAVAGLVGTTLSRLASEREIRQYRQHLERLVEERTVELKQTNEQLKVEILQRMRVEEVLQSEKEGLLRIFDTMEDHIYIIDDQYTIQYANPAFKTAFLANQEQKCFEFISDNGAVCVWCHRPEVFSGNTVRWEWSCPRNEKTYDVINIPMKNVDGSTAMLAMFRDISERKRKEDIIRQMAYHDALTGLPNRLLFEDQLNQALAQARQNQEKVILMMLDLDKFKDVNDTFGHDMGDALLKIVGDRMLSLIRKSDTVARLGGDEFTLIFPVVMDINDASVIAQKILNVFRSPVVLDGNAMFITTSIGIAIYPDDGENVPELIKAADIAMYYSKRAGRDMYTRFQPEMKDKPSRGTDLSDSRLPH